MTSKGLGEVFKVDSADTCAEKFPLMSMGGRAKGQACADGERGPPSVRAEIYLKPLLNIGSPNSGGYVKLTSKYIIGEGVTIWLRLQSYSYGNISKL
jgi:hypothetical protein